MKLAAAFGLLLLITAAPAQAQYGNRGRAREANVIVGVKPSILLAHSEVVRSRRTGQPLDPGRLVEERALAPGVGLDLRWGRSFQLYVGGAGYFGGDMDIAGRDPETGFAVDSTASTGTTYMATGGIAFIPIEPLRLEVGLGRVWLAAGGDYLAFRGAAFVELWDWSERLMLSAGAEAWAAGGSSEQDDLERQLRDGWLAAFSLGVDWVVD